MRKLRRDAGMTQGALAGHLGLTRGRVAQLEAQPLTELPAGIRRRVTRVLGGRGYMDAQALDPSGRREVRLLDTMHKLLMWLAARPLGAGPEELWWTCRELACELNVSRESLYRALEAVEEAGLASVRRAHVGVRVSLTESGHGYCAQRQPVIAGQEGVGGE